MKRRADSLGLKFEEPAPKKEEKLFEEKKRVIELPVTKKESKPEPVAQKKPVVETIKLVPAVTPPVSRVANSTNANLRLLGIGGIVLLALICGVLGLNYLIRNLPVATATIAPQNFPVATATAPFTPTLQPTNTPPANPIVGSTWKQTIDGMTMVYVPAGEFLMGSTNADTLAWASDNEKPQDSVTLDAYWIDQTDVTNSQYAKCVADNGACKEPANKSAYTRSSYYGNSVFDNYPVLFVDWEMANTYCSWADRRLPTEAEWEKAARGPDGNIYPWGNKGPDASLLNYGHNPGDTTEVEEYPNGKSYYGAYDMAGNVMQWVRDIYSGTYYQSSPSSNPLGPITGQYRVLRGGMWGGNEKDVRSAQRYWLDPADLGYGYSISFRCVRSP